MTGEVQGRIQKLLFNLSTENFAHAHKELETLVKDRINDKFNAAYQKAAQEAKAKLQQK